MAFYEQELTDLNTPLCVCMCVCVCDVTVLLERVLNLLRILRAKKRRYVKFKNKIKLKKKKEKIKVDQNYLGICCKFTCRLLKFIPLNHPHLLRKIWKLSQESLAFKMPFAFFWPLLIPIHLNVSQAAPPPCIGRQLFFL